MITTLIVSQFKDCYHFQEYCESVLFVFLTTTINLMIEQGPQLLGGMGATDG